MVVCMWAVGRRPALRFEKISPIYIPLLPPTEHVEPVLSLPKRRATCLKKPPLYAGARFI